MESRHPNNLNFNISVYTVLDTIYRWKYYFKRNIVQYAKYTGYRIV